MSSERSGETGPSISLLPILGGNQLVVFPQCSELVLNESAPNTLLLVGHEMFAEIPPNQIFPLFLRFHPSITLSLRVSYLPSIHKDLAHMITKEIEHTDP